MAPIAEATITTSALALRYGELPHQQLTALNTKAFIHWPLADYGERIIEATSDLFDNYPGYYAIFMELQGTMPKLNQTATDMDAQLIDAFTSTNAIATMPIQPN